MNLNPIQFGYAKWILQGNSAYAFREFKEEYNKFLFISRILRSYSKKNQLNIRLLLNHVIVLYNIFGDDATALFFLTSPKAAWPHIHTILLFLNRAPIPPVVKISEYNITIDLSEYPIDDNIMKMLNEL